MQFFEAGDSAVHVVYLIGVICVCVCACACACACACGAGRITPLRVNSYVDVNAVLSCVKGVQDAAAKVFTRELRACDQYFVDFAELKAWMTRVKITSRSFSSQDCFQFQ